MNSKISIFDQSKLWLDLSKMVKKNPGVSGCLDRYLIPIWLIKKSTQLIECNFRSIENRETGFLAEFSGDYSERLKRFQTLLTVLWNILTLHTCLLMKHNPMGINRGLRSLEILWSFSRIAICRTQHLGCIIGTNLL